MISQMSRAKGAMASAVQAAGDPIDSIHDRFPIPPFKQPPTKEDFHQTPRRRKPKPPENGPAEPERRDQGRLIDDYA
jgi:hypothetical protein